jgi:hypothetical protein
LNFVTIVQAWRQAMDFDVRIFNESRLCPDIGGNVVATFNVAIIYYRLETKNFESR